MRRVIVPILLIGMALALAAASATPASDAGDAFAASAESHGPSFKGQRAAEAEPLLALAALSNTGVVLQRVDPISLEGLSAQIPVGEYHDAWSLSPDRSQLALAVSAPGRKSRIGVLIVDVRSMQIVRGIETGIAAGALGWLAPRRLVAALLRGGTVLIDPATGEIIHRWPGFSFLDAASRVPNALAILFGGAPEIRYVDPFGTWQGTVTPRLGLADARGRFRSVPLERVRLSLRSSGAYTDRAGLAVDPSRAQAFVFAADAPAARVDLRTMRVSYHRLATSPTRGRGKNVLARARHALWLGDAHVAVLGHDLLRPAGRQRAPSSNPAGVTLIDTATWKARLLDPTADSAVVVSGMLLAYRSRGAARDGVRLYTVGGHRVATLLDGERVLDVQVAWDSAYVRTPSALYVLDVPSRTLVNKIVPPVDLVDLIGTS